MYLITAYFDEKTNKYLKNYINKVAEASGNSFMADHNVPPHLTISAIEAREEWLPELEHTVTQLSHRLHSGTIQFVSVGALFPYVLYTTPVLDEYLQKLQQQIYTELTKMENVKISRFYRPYQWLPHVTLGKTLEQEQMLNAFATMQKAFAPLKGNIVEIGLAKVNPHEDLVRFTLK